MLKRSTEYCSELYNFRATGDPEVLNVSPAMLVWRTGEWPTLWTQSLVLTLPKNSNLQLCQNYRTISLISHPSKVMLKIILNRLKPEAGCSTTEQIFNLRILCETYLQHQQDLYHVFIDFKKAFDRVCHAALWAAMRLYSINTHVINAIQNLYDKATSAVCFNWRLVQNYSRS